jgi:thiol:disulfide interchange protein DsbA
MTMFKRHIGWLFAAALSLLAFAAQAQTPLTVGRDYVPIDPVQATENPAGIEIVEFFSYGCPHCAEFHAPLGQWAAKLPKDVTLRRVPVSFGRPQWAALAKLYYALELTGDLARLDSAVFHALHGRGLRLYDDKSIIEWVGNQGVDTKKFTEVYNSFGVISKVKRGDQLAQETRIQGVPALAVDGRYLVVGKEISGFPALLSLTDRVIDKVRAEKARPGKAAEPAKTRK